MNSAKNDLETFYLFAKYLREYNETDDLKLLEEYGKEYVEKRIDPLLKREIWNDDIEIKKILLEIKYLKALLFYECKDIEGACKTIDDLDAHYQQHTDVDIDFMGSVFQKKKKYMALNIFRLICKKPILKQKTNNAAIP